MGLFQMNTKKKRTQEIVKIITCAENWYMNIEIETCFQETVKLKTFAGNLTTCEMNMMNKIMKHITLQ